jgi:hypothetical protein
MVAYSWRGGKLHGLRSREKPSMLPDAAFTNCSAK